MKDSHQQEDRQKIQHLIKEGKINSDQAIVLLHALNESAQRRTRIFQDVTLQKQKREKSVYGFLKIWLSVILVAIGIFLVLGINQQRGRHEAKALAAFDEAAVLIAQQDYPEAFAVVKKGVRMAPGLAHGQALLGTVGRLAQQATQEDFYGQESAKAFQKINNMPKDRQGGAAMTGTGVVFLVMFLILILSGVILVLLALYNSLVGREESVNAAWAQVAVFYQRKVDLIPALLEAVKQYAGHEKETLAQVVSARAKGADLLEDVQGVALLDEAQLSKIEDAQKGIARGLQDVSALVENYPQLKASDNYTLIQQQLQDTEDKVTRAREVFNRRVKSYNAGLRLFPWNIIAAAASFEPKHYFAASERSAT